jgi:hypothetical protein
MNSSYPEKGQCWSFANISVFGVLSSPFILLAWDTDADYTVERMGTVLVVFKIPIRVPLTEH